MSSNSLFKMSFLTLISLFPNLYKLTKVWVYKYNKVLFFGTGNSSGRLRFATHHNPDDQVYKISLI